MQIDFYENNNYVFTHFIKKYLHNLRDYNINLTR